MEEDEVKSAGVHVHGASKLQVRLQTNQQHVPSPYLAQLASKSASIPAQILRQTTQHVE